jgi:nucleoside-diphosphate-sugar epimerase
MKVLVTGATGFLGRHVVEALLRRGMFVRALVRPATDVAALGWGDRVEIFRADLRTAADLHEAFDGVDVLVHLAAVVDGDEEAQFASAVVGTERLLETMARAGGTRRLVLAGSFAEYDWTRCHGTLDESCPIEGEGPGAATGDGRSAGDPRRMYRMRDGYAVAKVWQERVCRRFADRHDWGLTVIRPGMLWGRGNADMTSAIGPLAGPIQLVFGVGRRVPLAHVENAADAFAAAAQDPRAEGKTFNLVDGHAITAWQYAGKFLRSSRRRAVRVLVPYFAGLALTHAATAVSRILFGASGRLPGVLVPGRFQARFKPLHFSNLRIRQELGWTPPLDLSGALARTFEAPQKATNP